MMPFLPCLLLHVLLFFHLSSANIYDPTPISYTTLPGVSPGKLHRLTNTLLSDSTNLYLFIHNETHNLIQPLLILEDGSLQPFETALILCPIDTIIMDMINPAPGVIVYSTLSPKNYTRLTSLLISYDLEAIVYTADLPGLAEIGSINAPNSTLVMYAGIDEADRGQITSVWLFGLVEGTIDFHPTAQHQIPACHNLVVSPPYVYTWQTANFSSSVHVCSYRLPYSQSALDCINTAVAAPYIHVLASEVALIVSPSTERIIMYLTPPNRTVIITLDMTYDGLIIHGVIDTPKSLHPNYFPLSYTGEFTVIRRVVMDTPLSLVDISSAHQIGELSNLPTWALNLDSDDDYSSFGVGFSAYDGQIAFVSGKSCDNADPPVCDVRVMALDISASLAPSSVEFMNNIPVFSYSHDLIPDESRGGFWFGFPSPPYLNFISVKVDNVTIFPINVQNVTQFSAGDPYWFGDIRKEPIDPWFSFTRNGKSITGDWRVHFAYYDDYYQSFTNVIHIGGAVGVPIARQMWRDPESGKGYFVVVRAVPETSYFEPNATVTVYVYESALDRGAFLSSPVASTTLPTLCLPLTLFINNGYPAAGVNHKFAVWSTDGKDEGASSEGRLSFSLALGTPYGADVGFFEFEYDSATRNLTLHRTITELMDLKVLQTMHVRGKPWILGASLYDSSYILVQMSPEQGVNCIIRLPYYFNRTIQAKWDNTSGFFAPSFSWWASEDGNRLAVSFDTSLLMFEISDCASDHDKDITLPNQIYQQDLNTPFPIGGIYFVKGRSYLVVLTTGTGSLRVIADCDPGFWPSVSNFCTACSPGTYGTACLNCPAGYVCDHFGMTRPTTPCPAGYFCSHNTDTLTFGTVHSPLPCSAGTYCPPGVGTGRIGTDLQSPKPCAANYYCPEASALPTAYACPNHTSSPSGSESIWDCTCIVGYFGFGGECIECPSQCHCVNSTLVGCWLPPVDIDTLREGIYPSLCPIATVTGNNNPCNPNYMPWLGNGSFPCANGYHGRLCSQCQPGYYSSGRECSKCNKIFDWLLPLGYSLLLTILVIYCWKVSPDDSAALKTVVFHFQTILTLVMCGLRWDNISARFLHGSSSSFNLSLVAIECIFPWWSIFDSLLLTALLPLMIGATTALMGASSYAFHHLTKAPQDKSMLRARMVKLFSLMVSFLYFSVSLIVFQIFGCTADSGTYYLNFYPWLRCPSSTWDLYVGVAASIFIIQVVGFPTALMIKLHRNRKFLETESNTMALGAFYMVYKSKQYYWEGILISRRIILAGLTTLIPYGSAMLLIGIFVVLQVYTMALLVKRPYVKFMDNVLDITSQFTLLTTLFCGLFISFEYTNETEISYFAGLINAVFLVLGIVVVVKQEVIPVIKQVPQAFKKTPKKAKQKSPLRAQTQVNGEAPYAPFPSDSYSSFDSSSPGPASPHGSQSDLTEMDREPELEPDLDSDPLVISANERNYRTSPKNIFGRWGGRRDNLQDRT